MKNLQFTLFVFLFSACTALHKGIPKHRAFKENKSELTFFVHEETKTLLKNNVQLNENKIIPLVKEKLHIETKQFKEKPCSTIQKSGCISLKQETIIDTIFEDEADTLFIEDEVLKKGKNYSGNILGATFVTVLGWVFPPLLIVGILIGFMNIIRFNRLSYWDEEVLMKKRKRTTGFIVAFMIPVVVILTLVIYANFF